MENQTPFYYKSTGAQIQICKGIHSCVCVHHCMSILTTFLFTQSRREIQRSWSMSCANPNAYVHLGEPNVCVSEHALNCDKGGWLRRKFQCDSLSQSNDVFHVFMAWGALQHLHRMDFYPTVKHLRAPAESREAKRNHKRSCCIRLSWTPTWIEITYQTQFLTHMLDDVALRTIRQNFMLRVLLLIWNHRLVMAPVQRPEATFLPCWCPWCIQSFIY